MTTPAAAAPPPRTGGRRPAAIPFPAAVGVGVLALGVVVMRSRPLTYWEHDELLFGAGVTRFEPLLHHPHPPGFPVLIGLGKALDLLVGDPFTSLVMLSALSSLVVLVMLALAFRNLLGDDRLALAGALLFSLSAGMLVHGTLPMSDPPALALLAIALWVGSRLERMPGHWPPVLLGVAGSLAVGCRPQLVVLAGPLVMVAALQRRPRLATASLAVGGFAAVSVLWLLPLVAATGGLRGFARFELGQLSFFVAQDVGLARSVRSPLELLLRFVAHPWGPKPLSGPVLAAAAAGLLAAVRKREWRLLPFVAAAGCYLLFAVRTMDPADGVRYALPATMATALLAARGLGWATAGRRERWRPALLLAVAAYGVGACLYVDPVVGQRHALPSPPAQAAAWAEHELPRDAAILYEAPLWPHATLLFPHFAVAPMGAGFGDLSDRADTPVYVLADGGSEVAGARVFAWRDSDAYRKLTRNHYRVVSLVPVPPGCRFRAIAGVWGPERTIAGSAWNWLAQTAEIGLPDIGARRVEVVLGLPAASLIPENAVRLLVDGEPRAAGVVRPGAPTTLTADLPGGAATVCVEAATSVVPDELPGHSSPDPRRLAIMLLRIRQLP